MYNSKNVKVELKDNELVFSAHELGCLNPVVHPFDGNYILRSFDHYGTSDCLFANQI